MKQPQLGRKLSELRKAKGFTQEELVEKCNISVRTIQRIETGEVNPRSYTLRTILSALGSNPEELLAERNQTTRNPKRFIVAWIAGLAYLLLGLVEGAMEFSRLVEESQIPGFELSDYIPVMEYSPFFYLIIKVLVLLTFLPFMWGIIGVGTFLGKSLIAVMAKTLMALMVFIIGYDLVSYFVLESGDWFFQLLIALILGIVGIIFGASLLQLRHQFGAIALLAGIVEIVSGVFFLMADPIGLLIQMIATLFEVILLYQFTHLQGRVPEAPSPINSSGS